MPELPEVQTTVDGLKRVLPYLFIKDVWTDLNTKDKRQSSSVKNPKYFEIFKTEVRGKRIFNVTRRGKNILIEIEGGKIILIHMKMTGHLLFGTYIKQELKVESGKSKVEIKEVWLPAPTEKNKALSDPFNRFIHFVFILKDPKEIGAKAIKHLAFSDMRKFGKITLIDKNELEKTIHLMHLGPEPLDSSFTKQKMMTQLLKKENGKIKQVLMDQSVISGIGNIYSDEMLWLAGIHPEEKVKHIPLPKFFLLYDALKEVLSKGIDFGGDSMSDYRNIDGKPGKFQHHHNAYRKTGKQCGKPGCTGVILRKQVGGRSAHYCSVHQKLINT